MTDVLRTRQRLSSLAVLGVPRRGPPTLAVLATSPPQTRLLERHTCGKQTGGNVFVLGLPHSLPSHRGNGPLLEFKASRRPGTGAGRVTERSLSARFPKVAPTLLAKGENEVCGWQGRNRAEEALLRGAWPTQLFFMTRHTLC